MTISFDLINIWSWPFPKRQMLDPSKLKDFADDNFNLEKWQKVLQMFRKQCGKRRNCSLLAICPFPTVLSKILYCRHVKTRACFRNGQTSLKHNDI